MPSVLIIENYLQNVIHIFGNKKNINLAISQRGLIYDPAYPRDSKAPPNLETLQKQFYSNGNKRRSATFRFVDKDRAESDIQLFLRPDNITDRERIALLSIFYAATHFAFSPLNVMSRGIAEVMQIVIARRIRDVAGFTTPLGYEPRPEMITALHAMMEELDEIYEQCRTVSDLNYQLMSTVPKLSRIKNNTKDKSVKHEFVVDILAAIGDYSRSHDFYKLFDVVKNIKYAVRFQVFTKGVLPVADELYLILIRAEPLFIKNTLLHKSVLTMFAQQREKQKIKSEPVVKPDLSYYRYF